MAAALVRRIRAEAKLSLRALAESAGLATSTVHRIERGDLRPTLETLRRIAEAAGVRLHIEPRTDYAASLVGLARLTHAALAERDPTRPVRMAAEFAQTFRAAVAERRHRMIAAEPPSTGDPRWDAFVGALAEWVTVGTDMSTPGWTQSDGRFLRRGWWVTPMASMRAWEYAGSPASFQRHGVYLHRDSLTNV